MWVSRSRTVISRSGNVVRYFAGLPSAHTRRSANDGMNFDTGSFSWNAPSSYSVMSATLTIGFVIE